MNDIALTIQSIIQRELSRRELKNIPGYASYRDAVRKRLTDLYKRDFLIFRGPVEQFWVVFDEMPGNAIEGHLVIFDERKNRFGLATKTSFGKSGTGFLLGFYSSFLAAVDSLNLTEKLSIPS